MSARLACWSRIQIVPKAAWPTRVSAKITVSVKRTAWCAVRFLQAVIWTPTPSTCVKRANDRPRSVIATPAPARPTLLPLHRSRPSLQDNMLTLVMPTHATVTLTIHW